MSRERYTREFECKECGEKGTLKISENDYAFMRKLDRNISVVEGNIDAVVIGDQKVIITCKKCGTEKSW
jgi:transcription elongation factor Elf1